MPRRYIERPAVAGALAIPRWAGVLPTPHPAALGLPQQNISDRALHALEHTTPPAAGRVIACSHCPKPI